MAGAATKDQLGRILGGDSPPAFLFTASHGAAFPFGDALQRSHQGALICQDWPGPQAWRDRGLDERFYFRGDDLSPDANLLGTIAFLFACYGAGTPRVDQVSARVPGQVEMAAAAAFVSALPKAMLSLSRGAALAVIGHVDLAFGCSFQWPGMGKDGSSSQIVAFESALRGLMGGLPVGAAMDYFDLRYAELAVELGRQRDRADSGLPYDPEMLGLLWTASSDARDTILLGDPAVRLAVSETGQTRTRDTVTVPSIRSEPPVAVVAPLPAVGPDVDTGSLTLGLLDRKDGESKSTELWQIHSQLVQQAQESRAQRMSCDQDPSGILWPAPGYAGGATPSPSPLRGCVRETWPSTASGRGAWSTAHSSNPEIHGAPPWPATSSRTPSRPSETASRQVKDISTLTVETRIKELGSADAPTLAARPVIKLDGDNGSDLPMVKDAEGKLVVDQALVDHHMQKMEAAIAWRAKMLESLIGLLRGQVSASHPTGSPNTLIKR